MKNHSPQCRVKSVKAQSPQYRRKVCKASKSPVLQHKGKIVKIPSPQCMGKSVKIQSSSIGRNVCKSRVHGKINLIKNPSLQYRREIVKIQSPRYRGEFVNIYKIFSTLENSLKKQSLIHGENPKSSKFSV